MRSGFDFQQSARGQEAIGRGDSVEVDAAGAEGGAGERFFEGEPDFGRGDSGEAIELAVADGRAGGDGFPGAGDQGFDFVLGDALAKGEHFLGADDVEGARLAEIDFQPSSGDVVVGGPVGVGIAVDGAGGGESGIIAAGVAGGGGAVSGEVGAEDFG